MLKVKARSRNAKVIPPPLPRYGSQDEGDAHCMNKKLLNVEVTAPCMVMVFVDHKMRNKSNSVH